MRNKIFKILIIIILAINVVYAKNNPGIDKATFQEIDSGYSKDKNSVYVRENRGWKKLEGLDPNTFELVSNYGSVYLKDKNGVYVISGDSDNLKLEKLPYRDGKTFEVMDQLYSRDKNNIYYKGERIIGVDIPTFEKIDKYVYSKDKNNIYFRGRKISGVDKNTFKKIDELQYSKDKNNIYYGNKKIEGVDRNTFEVINDYYSKDKNSVYYENNKLKGIDVKTFEKKDKLFHVENFLIKDKNGFYIVEEDGNVVPLNSQEVDIESLSQLVYKTNLYQDKNSMYFVKNHKLEKIKNTPKVDKYDLFVYNENYINKYDIIYYLDTDEGAFKKLEEAELGEFHVFDTEYAKGKKNVYFKDKILTGADYKSFEKKYNEEKGVYEIRDKNKIYKTLNYNY